MGLTRNIEVDEATADALEHAAADSGVTLRELMADFAAMLRTDAEDMAELERRWAAVQAGEETVPHEEVARWLKTVGTPDFKPWRKD